MPVVDLQARAAEVSSSEPVPVRLRLTHAVGSLATICLLGWWSWYSDPDPNLSEIMASPAAFDGQEVKIGDEPILESVEADWFVVCSCDFRFRVAGTVSPADIGRFIYVRGVFQRPASNAEWDGVIQPAEHYVARGRRAKIWLSVLPVIWIGVLLLRHFRVDRQTLAVDVRHRVASPPASPHPHS